MRIWLTVPGRGLGALWFLRTRSACPLSEERNPGPVCAWSQFVPTSKLEGTELWMRRQGGEGMLKDTRDGEGKAACLLLRVISRADRMIGKIGYGKPAGLVI